MNRILNTSHFISSLDGKYPCKMTLQKFAFLSLLAEKPMLTVRAGISMGVTQSTASTSMEALRLAGLAARSSEEYAAPYRITARGAELLHDFQQAMDGITKYDPPAIKRQVPRTKAISAVAGKMLGMPKARKFQEFGPAPLLR